MKGSQLVPDVRSFGKGGRRMKIAILGTGYVGLVAGLCFADAGHEVTCADTDSAKINTLKNGQLPFFEPGLTDLLERNRSRVRFVHSVAEAVGNSDVSFLTVGTPEGRNGHPDMNPTFETVTALAHAVRAPHTLVIKSTVPIGTHSQVSSLMKAKAGYHVEVISNPEFLRQGSAVEDFMHPDRIVLGASSRLAARPIEALYEPFLSHGQECMVMDPASAEMSKYVANAFLALKISFINELALLADKVGADIDQVRKSFTADFRINSAYFDPGIGYGGSCFPKDIQALVSLAETYDLKLCTLRAAEEVNERQKGLLFHYVQQRFQSLAGLKVAVWGLSFKPQTDDVRRAPSLTLISRLQQAGAQVSAYDPIAGTKALAASALPFDVAASPLDAAAGASALLVVTDWPLFRTVDLAQLHQRMRHPIVFDGRNLFDPVRMKNANFEYTSIGRQLRTQGSPS